MLTRIITAAVLIAAVLAWLFMATPGIYTMGALFMYAVGAYEMGPLLGFKSKLPFLAVAVVTVTLIFYISNPGLIFYGAQIPCIYKWIIASAVVAWLVSIPLLLKYPKDTAWHNIKALNVVIALLMLVPFVLGLLVLRASDEKTGSFTVLAVMALVWCADSGAYFTGRFLGRHKMLPNVSPKKTVEGLFGGLVTALVGLFIFNYLGWFGSYSDNMYALVTAGVLAIIFSVIGDLVESMLKRIAGIKDSGKIFPGHGGMLDRIDSQLSAIPVFITTYVLVSGTV
ncbi:MAG: phosphatidate cytidylyltransferase [Succinivibrio sp.]